VSNNVPVDAARKMGADRVIGVHVVARGSDDQSTRPQGWLGRRLAEVPTVARALTLLRAQLHAHYRLSERQVLTADVAILVDTTGFAPTHFWRAEGLIAAGRRAGQAVHDQLQLLRA
jgi:predicted acylesterase/phospholipase RssA